MTPPVPSPADRETVEVLYDADYGRRGPGSKTGNPNDLCWKVLLGQCVIAWDHSKADADALAESILAALARARLAGAEAERERCAKVAEQWANGQDSVAVLKEQDDCPASAQSHEEAAVVGRWIASAIRAIDPAAVVGGRPAPEVPRQ